LLFGAVGLLGMSVCESSLRSVSERDGGEQDGDDGGGQDSTTGSGSSGSSSGTGASGSGTSIGSSGSGSGPGDAGAAGYVTDSGQDAAVDAANDQEPADSPQNACDLGAPFGVPVPIAGAINTAAKEGGPRLTADELTMYFSRAVAGATSSLFIAHRSSATAPFDTATPLTALDESFDEYDPTTSTELAIFFTAVDRASSCDIWGATRASAADSFGAPGAVGAVNSGASEQTPFLTADSAALWFASNRPGGPGNYDLYRAAATGASFDSPALVAELSTSSNEFTPTLAPDRLVVFFSSDRPGGLGGEDIWTASRGSVNDAFSGVAAVSPVNSGSDDFPGWLSADGCRLYMSSLRSGNEDIYVAVRGR
jgi:hypothetical protein